MRTRATSGFSLAEVMVAMFVIVVGIAGVTSTIWWGMQKSDSGKLINEASNIGRVIVENIVAQGMIGNATPAPPAWPNALSGINDSATDRRELDAAPLNTVVLDHIANAVDNTHSDWNRFRRNIRCVQMGAPGSGIYDEVLCTLSVRIYWQEKKTVTGNTIGEHHIAHELVAAHGRPIP